MDLAEDGRVLRDVRFELLLPARDREWSFDLHDAIAVPFPRANAAFQANALPRLEAAASKNADGVSEWPSPAHFTLRRTLRQWSPAMVRITSFAETTDTPQPDWDAALAHFRRLADVKTWSPDAMIGPGFHFETQKRGSDDERIVRNRRGRIPGVVDPAGTDDDRSFVRWAAFGESARTLGGLSISASPAIAGISDFGGARECANHSLVVCAWRRADGELLIYRRIFPAK